MNLAVYIRSTQRQLELLVVTARADQRRSGERIGREIIGPCPPSVANISPVLGMLYR